MVSRKHKILNSISSNSKDPEKTALQLYTGETLTYGELTSLINLTQAAIQRFSIKPSDRIALSSNNNLVYPALLLAIIENATCVPLDYNMSFEEYEKYYELMGVDYLMFDQIEGAALAAAITQGIGIIEFHSDDQIRPTSLHFDLLQKAKSDHEQNEKNDQTAIIFTTSGTTSLPKVVPKLYQDVFEAIEIEAKNLDFTEDSFHMVATQLFRFPTIWILLKAFATNGSLIYLDGINPKRIADTILKYKITHTYLPPAGLVSFYEYGENNAITYNASHTMFIIVYGAPLPYQVKNDIEKRFHALLVDVYGMTEIGIATTTHKTPKGYKPGSVGYPLAQEIKILNDEILVKGVGVFAGYENNPDVNRDNFIDGWFRTGDVGYLDEDGYLFIKSRIRELINRGGEKVSPFEIEEAILSLGNITETAVFPYPNKQGSDEVGAVIVPHPESAIGLRDLRHALKDKIKPYKLPTLLYIVKKIPKSGADKVQRRFLYGQLQDLTLLPETLKNAPVSTESNLTSTQFTIREIWKTVLEQDYISLDDIFFDLGGDSLSAAEVLADIESRFGCVLPVNQFFQKSTVRELAELVDAAPKFNPYKHIVPIRPGGNKPPLFFVHDRSGDNITYHHITEHIDNERPVYGLNFNWQREAWNGATSIRDVARAYIEEIQQVAETDPYYLAGLSIGGQIAFEMGSILAERDCDVVVFMIDTYSIKQIKKMAIQESTRGTINSLKQASFTQIPKLVYKKIGTLYNEFVLPEINSGSNIKARPRIDTKLEQAKSEKFDIPALLKSISKNHQPVYSASQVCYFRALQSTLKRNPSYLFWKSLSKEFTLFETGCGHADFVKPEYAADTAAKITLVIKENEIQMSQV